MRLGDAADMLIGFAFKSSGFLDAGSEGVKLMRGDNVQQGFIRWGDKTKLWPSAEISGLETEIAKLSATNPAPRKAKVSWQTGRDSDPARKEPQP